MQLRFNQSYGCHCELLLRSGVTVALDWIRQGRTYAGTEEGIPYRRTNDMIIEDIVAAAPGEPHRHLIPPQRRDYYLVPGDRQPMTVGFEERHPEYLPPVYCIGHFLGVAATCGSWLSALTVVWFQDEYAFPILEPAMRGLRAMDWASLATEIDSL